MSGLFAPAVRPPTPATLARYGLAEAEWLTILAGQGGVCAICRRVPRTGRFVIDHEHVPGWKEMSPYLRRRHVRGLLCSFCNSHCVGRFMTLPKAGEVLKYLTAYHGRK